MNLQWLSTVYGRWNNGNNQFYCPTFMYLGWFLFMIRLLESCENLEYIFISIVANLLSLRFLDDLFT